MQRPEEPASTRRVQRPATTASTHRVYRPRKLADMWPAEMWVAAPGLVPFRLRRPAFRTWGSAPAWRSTARLRPPPAPPPPGYRAGAAVGAHRAVVAARQRRTLRPRPGLPARHRRHLHVQLDEVPKEGVSAGVTMAAALVSALTRRRGHPRWTGAPDRRHRREGAGRAPRRVAPCPPAAAQPQAVDEDLGDDLRRVVAVDYLTGRRCWSWPCSPRRLRAAWRHSRRPAARPEPAEREPARCDEDE